MTSNVQRRPTPGGNAVVSIMTEERPGLSAPPALAESKDEFSPNDWSWYRERGDTSLDRRVEGALHRYRDEPDEASRAEARLTADHYRALRRSHRSVRGTNHLP